MTVVIMELNNKSDNGIKYLLLVNLSGWMVAERYLLFSTVHQKFELISTVYNNEYSQVINRELMQFITTDCTIRVYICSLMCNAVSTLLYTKV